MFLYFFSLKCQPGHFFIYLSIYLILFLSISFCFYLSIYLSISFCCYLPIYHFLYRMVQNLWLLFYFVSTDFMCKHQSKKKLFFSFLLPSFPYSLFSHIFYFLFIYLFLFPFHSFPLSLQINVSFFLLAILTIFYIFIHKVNFNVSITGLEMKVPTKKHLTL